MDRQRANASSILAVRMRGGKLDFGPIHGEPRQSTPSNPTKVLFAARQNQGMLEIGRRIGRSRPFDAETTRLLTKGTKPFLILVEDDPSVLRALRRMMLSAGFQVMAFDRPRAVLDSELPKSDACLVVDVHLPEMNGVQLCETLAASGCRLPIIMITGNIDQATRELVRRANAVAVLYKPFTRAALLETIAVALAAGKQA
jgi:CheY-like chemotaxis protein